MTLGTCSGCKLCLGSNDFPALLLCCSSWGVCFYQLQGERVVAGCDGRFYPRGTSWHLGRGNLSLENAPTTMAFVQARWAFVWTNYECGRVHPTVVDTPLWGSGWYKEAGWASMRSKPLSMFLSGLWFSSCCQVLTLFEFLPWLLQWWTSRRVCSLEVQAKWAPYLFKLPLFMVTFITYETQLGHRLKEWFYISTAGWTKECIGVIYRCMNNLWAAPPP